MHSESVEKAVTPRKRTLSRTQSEDESLRSIIEAEGLGRRVVRTDSKGGSHRRLDKQESLIEDDVSMKFPDMIDLQEEYSEMQQELRSLELQREVLLFQVDCLQDALLGTEEMLAESQRQANHATTELEKEKQERRKLEDLVTSLQLKIQQLKEVREQQVWSTARLQTPVRSRERSREQVEELPEVADEAKEEDVSVPDGHTPVVPPSGEMNLGSSVDSEEPGPAGNGNQAGSPLARFQTLVHKAFAQINTLSLAYNAQQEASLQSILTETSPTVEEAAEIFPDDAVSQESPTQVQEPPHTHSLPPEELQAVAQPVLKAEISVPHTIPPIHTAEVLGHRNSHDPKNPKHPDACVLS